MLSVKVLGLTACLTRRVMTCSILQTDEASVVLEAANHIVSLEGRVNEIPAELTTTRQSRNLLHAMPPAYFSTNVRVHVSGLGEMGITIHSPEDARQLYRLFHEFVSGVIDSSRYFGPDMLHLDMSTVGFAASYTLHSQVRKIAFHMLWSWCYWWIRYYFVGSIGYVIYTCDDPFLVVKCFVYYIVSGVNKSLTF